MGDRELLGMAAKAAGVKLDGPASRYVATADPRSLLVLNDRGGHTTWNPLTDDGDALRLAVLLSIDVLHRIIGGRRCEALAPGGAVVEVFYKTETDACAATRRAIVRAAAEIGKAMAPSTDGGKG